MQAANNLLKELGRLIGLEELALDDAGQCTLAFDETIVLTFVVDQDDGLNVVSYIGELEPGNPRSAQALLERNFTPVGLGGGRVAMEPDSERVVLVSRWDAVRTDFALFQQQLEEFVNAVEAIRKALEEGPASAPLAGTPTREIVPPPGSFA